MLSAQLEVITGCMSSGKTEELLRRLERARYAGIQPIVFKPSIDTRSGGQVCSRNGICIDAITIASSREIREHIHDSHRLIAIDEAQFFDEGLVDVVMSLVRQGRWVIVSGLDLDYREVPFRVMAELIVRAHPVTKLTAVCVRCQSREATRSQRLIGGGERVVIGDREYEPRCLECFELPNEPVGMPTAPPIAVCV